MNWDSFQNKGWPKFHHKDATLSLQHTQNHQDQKHVYHMYMHVTWQLHVHDRTSLDNS